MSYSWSNQKKNWSKCKRKLFTSFSFNYIILTLKLGQNFNVMSVVRSLLIGKQLFSTIVKLQCHPIQSRLLENSSENVLCSPLNSPTKTFCQH